MSWTTASLSDIATIERNSILPANIKSGSRYVGLDHIESGGGSIRFGSVENGELASSKFQFGPDHILFGKLRPYLAKVVCPDFKGICSTDIIPIAPSKRVDKRYLLHFLRCPETISWAAGRATGVNLPRLSPKELASLEIPIPPLDEQRRIAAILDKADALRRKRKRAIELLESLTLSIFWKMFGGQEYPVYELKDVVKKGTIVTYGIVQAGPEFANGIPYIRTGDLVNGNIEIAGLRRTDPAIAARFSRSRVEAGDIVMSIRATVGTTAVVPPELEGANLTQGTARIAPGESVQLDYLIEYIRTERTQRWIAAQVKGATFLEITLGRLRELPVAVPPPDLQNEFSRIVQRIRRGRDACFRQGALADNLFSALQSRAFSGQL